MKEVKRKSFKNEIKKAFILYSLTPIMIISLIFYNGLFIYFIKFVDYENEKINNNIGAVIEEEFKSYEDACIKIANDKKIHDILLQKATIDTNIYENFYNIVNARRIKSIFHIYNTKGENILSNVINKTNNDSDEYLYTWGLFKKMNTNPSDTVMLLNRVQLNVNTRTVFSIGKPIMENNKIIGFVVFDILENELNDIIHSNSNDNVVITDKYNNNIVSTNNALLDRIGKLRKIEDNENLKVIKTERLNGNVYIHTFKSVAFINNTYFLGEIFLISLFILLFSVLIYFANKIAINKTKSVDKLLKAITSVQKGDLSNKVSINSDDEFQLIGEYYNEMVIKIEELIEKNKEETMQATLSQIKLLESQFNPHFIFNTLEMLKYMIKANDSSAEKVILSMSRILRYSIDNAIRTTMLGEDIKYIQDYLMIQKFRFGSKFDYSINMNDECKMHIIPKLIIQPIVENSIKYGFESKDYLIINVDVKIEEEDFMIYITDNGDGISPERLLEINEILNGKDNSSSHIGLYNVKKRISLLYGEDYGLKIESDNGKGTKVTIKLPLN
ncbi:two-component sensor histidine kinase [Clostridium beijerinckii]|nr:two-component sensor histidine kinase [Clostridium beijerinckii]